MSGIGVQEIKGDGIKALHGEVTEQETESKLARYRANTIIKLYSKCDGRTGSWLFSGDKTRLPSSFHQGYISIDKQKGHKRPF